MGSPLSPVVANLFMEKFEQTELSTAPLKPTIWYRYIDDTFVLWRHGRENLDIFLDHLNQQHLDIQFTMEVEQKHQLAFLDVLVCRQGIVWTIRYIEKPPTQTDMLCRSVYIGISKRSVATRIEEHLRNCKLGHVEKSAVAERAFSDGTHNIYFGEAHLLATTTGYRPRLIREAIEIQNHDDNFNRKGETMALNRI
uniref:Reverse transcriptase domain-containing protein n=1 Tax=Dendroctonus ponderosae TaxID=77166 RepID=A0AAR5NZE7_DENPD